MFLPKYNYLQPTTLEEALGQLSVSGGRISPLAGGTDLLLALKEGKAKPDALLSLREIPELHKINLSADRVTIGAGVTVAELTGHKFAQKNPAFADLVRQFASAPIRNRATIGGNICNAAACGDLAPILLINDAQVTIASASGSRSMPLSKFIVGPRQTELRDDELLLSISFRAANPGSSYIKFGPRQAVNIAIVGVACSLALEGDLVSELRVSVTAASPAPILLAPELALGKSPDESLWREIAEIVAETLSPISDLRASSEYRLELARVGTRRGLASAFERLSGPSNG